MRHLAHRAQRSGFLFAAGTALLLALALLLLAMADVKAAERMYPDVRVLRSDEAGLEFAFTPQHWKFDTGFADGVVLSFEDAQWSTEPNAPALPQRSVLIAVPSEGDVTITATPSGWQQVSNRAAATRGELAAANTRKPSAPPLVRWDGPFRSRDLRLVRIWLAPVQSTQGQLSRTDEVNVSVRWSGHAKSRSLQPNVVFDPVYEKTLLNWPQARAFAAQPARAALTNPWSAGGQWFKVTVQADGPHRITLGELAAAGFPTGSDPRQYRMFYSGGERLPVANTDPRPVLHEVPVEITGEGDGSFDPGDALYFFGQAANRWQNDDSDAVYVQNPYTRDVVFWLAPSGTFSGTPLRIGTQAAAPGTEPLVTQGVARATSEQDLVQNQVEDDYYTWYWQETSSLSLVMNLPGARSGAGYVAVTSRNTFLPSNSTVRVNGAVVPYASSAGFRSLFNVNLWLPNTAVQLNYNSTHPTFIDRVEAVYAADLDYAVLREFWLNSASGNHAWLNNVPAGAILWDVTAADSPFVVQGTPAGTGLAFNPGAALREHRFRVWTRAEAKTVTSIASEQPGLLRDSPPSADLLILAHPSVRAPLDAYAAWRSARSGITTDIVDVTDVYRDFGFGQFDPLAIRDFLNYAYAAARPSPSACLLVGDGSYDFLNHLGSGAPNLIPPFIVSPLYDETAGDQNYVSFGALGTLDLDSSRINQSDRGWDMMVARWPVGDVAEVQTIAGKIQQYESQPELGTWRNRVVIVADDEFGESGVGSEFFHTEQAEGIDAQIPASYDRSKVYLFEFEKDASGHKPGARDAIVRNWNDGMLLIDYVGHGSPNVWAHEDVFRRTRDLPALVNGGRLPLVYTASCSIGFFDDPQSPGMGEELLRKAGGGAIAVISATRLVFSQPNVDLNRVVFQLLFGPALLSVGQSLFGALLQRQYILPGGPDPIENDRKHVLLGDPFMKLARPVYTAAFDTAVVPDTIVALRPVHVAGTVVDSTGAPLSLGGNVILSVRDAPRQRQYQVQSRTVFYTLEGRPIYDGAFPSTGPTFDYTLMVPKDVSYGANGARIVVYAQGTTADALGVLAPLPVSSGADTTSDAAGPLWDLTINSTVPSGRVRVGPADVWRAQITDPLGINIGGTTGHGITVTIDGDEFSRQDVTGLFRYDVGSISTGALSFSLPKLEPGPHEIELLAWDNANNPGLYDVSVEASGDVQYEIRDLLVYPNPFDPDVEPANLTYELTFPPDRVQLSLYTVAGNKIRTFDDPQADIGFNFATRWDGTDDVGDRVAAGVYILAVEAEAAGHKVKDFTKVVLIRSD